MASVSAHDGALARGVVLNESPRGCRCLERPSSLGGRKSSRRPVMSMGRGVALSRRQRGVGLIGSKASIHANLIRMSARERWLSGVRRVGVSGANVAASSFSLSFRAVCVNGAFAIEATYTILAAPLVEGALFGGFARAEATDAASLAVSMTRSSWVEVGRPGLACICADC